MQTFQVIAGLPDKCPIDSIQGKVVEVYNRTVRDDGKSLQAFILVDGSGAKLKVSAWDHADLSSYKGKDIVIAAGPKGGLTNSPWQGKSGVSASRTCTFQFLTVHTAQTQAGATDTPTQPQNPVKGTQSTSNGPSCINGQQVGMAIKAAIDILLAQGNTDPTKKEIWETASMIIRVGQYIEQGNLYPLPKTEDSQKVDTSAQDAEDYSKAQEAAKAADEDVPF